MPAAVDKYPRLKQPMGYLTPSFWFDKITGQLKCRLILVLADCVKGKADTELINTGWRDNSETYLYPRSQFTPAVLSERLNYVRGFCGDPRYSRVRVGSAASRALQVF